MALTAIASARFNDLLKKGLSWTNALALADRVDDADLAAAVAGGMELAEFQLYTSLAGATAVTTIGVQSSSTDQTKDVVATGFTVAPEIGVRPAFITVDIMWFTGVSGSFCWKLYDITPATPVCLDQDNRGTITALQGQPKVHLSSRIIAAPGIRQYAVKVNGTAGAVAISGIDQGANSGIRVVSA